MKTNDIHVALNNLDEGIIESVDQIRKSGNTSGRMKKWLAAAACFAFAVVSLFVFGHKLGGELQKLTVTFDFDAYGCESCFVKSIDDLKSGNPWKTDMEIKKLPVYKNLFTEIYDEVTDKKTLGQMKSRLEQVAKEFGLDSQNTVTEEGRGIMYISGKTYTAEVDSTGTVRVKAELDLPAEYGLSDNPSYDDLKKTAEYILKNHSDILKMKNPTASINGGDYAVNGDEQYYGLSFFDSEKSIEEDIVNFNFHSVYAIGDGKSKITFNWVFNDLSKEIGCYPIISAEEAENLLSDGYYLTSETCEFPENPEIGRVELVYRHGVNFEYLMPFYKFYVDVTEVYSGTIDKDVKIYGVYYVPAVEKSYLTNFKIWDGDLNSYISKN